MADATYRLTANDLYSKFGFGDGDGLSDFLADHEIYAFEMDGDSSSWDPTIEVVRTYLVPLLPAGLEVEEWGTSHNPMRAADYGQPLDESRRAELEKIFVDVTVAQILALKPKAP